jgi:hypothetical protein
MNDTLGDYQENFDGFMAGVEEKVHELIRQSAGAPRSALDAWKAFYYAVGKDSVCVCDEHNR